MRVVILAPPGVQSLDVVGPAEVFWEAARRLGDPSAYEVQVMGTTAGAVCGTGNLRFLVDSTIYDPDEPIDTRRSLLRRDRPGGHRLAQPAGPDPAPLRFGGHRWVLPCGRRAARWPARHPPLGMRRQIERRFP